ncbi:hypothetical protein ACFV6F_26540 [Kitasatospora phosalacinea]|uniref:hypothetical protein n=1 Tax=Kitasatospora phosalacinea TaxID=2065 RepID=UPI00365841F8
MRTPVINPGALLWAVPARQLPSGCGMPVDFSDTDFAGQARRVLEDSTAEALGGHPGLEVVLKAVQPSRGTRRRCWPRTAVPAGAGAL